MVEMKVHLSPIVNERFRRLAMTVYGFGRGSLSRAAEEAFSKWCAEHEAHSSRATEPNGLTVEKPVENAAPGINPDERPVTTTESTIAEKNLFSQRDKSST